MSFVVRMPATDPRAGAFVFLTRSSFRDGADKLIYNWSYQVENAKIYKTRAGAERAIERAGNGEVIEHKG